MSILDKSEATALMIVLHIKRARKTKISISLKAIQESSGLETPFVPPHFLTLLDSNLSALGYHFIQYDDTNYLIQLRRKSRTRPISATHLAEWKGADLIQLKSELYALTDDNDGLEFGDADE